MNLGIFEALDLLYSFNRRNELESSVQWKSQESPADDPLNMRKKGKEPVNVEQVRQWVAKG